MGKDEPVNSNNCWQDWASIPYWLTLGASSETSKWMRTAHFGPFELCLMDLLQPKLLGCQNPYSYLESTSSKEPLDFLSVPRLSELMCVLLRIKTFSYRLQMEANHIEGIRRTWNTSKYHLSFWLVVRLRSWVTLGTNTQVWTKITSKTEGL